MADLRSGDPFEQVAFSDLAHAAKDDLDALPFGVVGLSRDGLVAIYNATEERLAGLPRDKVLGLHFFDSVAQCMNNFMVAQRYEDEPELDVIIDYVLTLKMRPTPVRLRLLQQPDAPLRYLLVHR